MRTARNHQMEMSATKCQTTTMKEEKLSIGALRFIHHGSRSDTTREQLKPPNNVTQSEKNNNVTQSEKSKCVKLKANIF